MAAGISASISLVDCNRSIGPRPGWRTSVDHRNLSPGDACWPSMRIVSFGNSAAAYGNADVAFGIGVFFFAAAGNVSQVVHAAGQ